MNAARFRHNVWIWINGVILRKYIPRSNRVKAERRRKMIIRNRYRVPKKQWAKWSRQARFVFNEFYRRMDSQEVLAGPQTFRDIPTIWRVIRWNAAWLAADLATKSRNDFGS